MTGVLLVDKPEGMTSAGAIRVLKDRLGRAKVGHLGTLDPFASGLLPLCIGEATKLARYLLAERKAYEGTIRLGAATDTMDRTGRVLRRAAVPALSEPVANATAARFSGLQRQTPPMFSALKREGVPLYVLARQGVEVARPAREIEVFAFRLWPSGEETLDFEVTCSKGTYIRALAADVGEALGTVAHLERLRRVRVGAFVIESAHTPAAIHALPADAPLPVLGIREALPDLVGMAASAEVVARLRRGQQERLADLPPPRDPAHPALLIDPSGAVVAVVEPAGAPLRWRLVRLLSAS